MTFVTTDIDECNEGKMCPGKQICVNEVGSYRCLCIKGYHKVEEVCVPNSPAISPTSQPTIYLAVGEYIYCMSILYD